MTAQDEAPRPGVPPQDVRPDPLHAALREIRRALDNLPSGRLADFPRARTALVIIDMVNGFTREGALQSPHVQALIPAVRRLLEACVKRGIPALAFADNHPGDSPEFLCYPAHCVAGTSEAEIVDELKEVGGYTLIPKNSTNGFLEPRFQAWLGEHPEIDHFIVVGDCTDICIEQFATTLKAHFNRNNAPARVVVPVDAVDTFDAGPHSRELMHLTALFSMIGNGVEVVDGIQV